MDVEVTQQMRIRSTANSGKKKLTHKSKIIINAISAKTMLGVPSSMKSKALIPGVLHLIPGTVFEKNIVISWKKFETGLKKKKAGKELKGH